EKEEEKEPAVRTTADSGAEAFGTTAVALPDGERSDEEDRTRQIVSGRRGPAAPGLLTSIASSTDLPPRATRNPRDGRRRTLDGAQDTTDGGDVEMQRNDRRGTESYQLGGPSKGKRARFFLRYPYAQDLLHGLVRATYVVRTLMVFTLFIQIPITLAVIIIWALIPRLPLPNTAATNNGRSSSNNSNSSSGSIDSFGLEFVFLMVSLIGYVLVLVGRAAPRIKEGTLEGVRGYSRLLRRGGRLEKDLGMGFIADIVVEAVVASAFMVVLVMKAVVLDAETGAAGTGAGAGAGGGSSGTCLKGRLVPPGTETQFLSGGEDGYAASEGAAVATAAAAVAAASTMAEELARWAWGSSNCRRLVAVVSLLAWEV
ncbi:hypothetical protein GP486_008603, partial [Trichoglossum hirsutum]